MRSELIFVVLIFVTVPRARTSTNPRRCANDNRLSARVALGVRIIYVLNLRTYVYVHALDLGRDRDREELRTFTVY